MAAPEDDPRLSIQPQEFDHGAEVSALGRGRADMGAVVSFLGQVRDDTGRLLALEIEHYPGMSQRAIAAMIDEAERRWSLGAVRVIHRHGRLVPGAAIMMVATAARHRAEAFAAAEFLMDYLKSRAPFWKKEIFADGADWVAAKPEDEGALARW